MRRKKEWNKDSRKWFKSYKEREPITTYLRVKTLGMLINVYKAREKPEESKTFKKSVSVCVCEQDNKNTKEWLTHWEYKENGKQLSLKNSLLIFYKQKNTDCISLGL